MARPAKIRPPSEFFDRLRFLHKLAPELEELTAEERAELGLKLQQAMGILLPHITDDPSSVTR